MIQLYQFAPLWGLSSGSPFCTKLETYLRMAKLPYRTVNDADVRKAPKSKLPYIEDDGQIVADSGFIVEHLKSRYGDSLDGGLSALERAQALTLRRMLEEGLYWAMVYARWIEPKNWRITKPAYFGAMPPLVRSVVPELIRKGVQRALYAQGYGRHTRDEIYRLGCQDLTALSDFIGDKSFCMGAHPTSLDATAYAWVAHILLPPLESPLQRHAQSLTNLRDYCTRMHTLYFIETTARNARDRRRPNEQATGVGNRAV